MKAKNLIILVAAAAVLGSLAYISSLRKIRDAKSDIVGKHVLPELQKEGIVNGIEKIVLVSSAGTVTVKRAGDVWVSHEKHNYPVDFGKVSDFVRKIVDLKIGQPVPSGSRQLEKLDLVSPDSVATGKSEHVGTLLRFIDKTGNTVVSMIIGKQHMKKAAPDNPYGGYPDGRFIAVGDKAFLVAETLSGMPAQAKDWLDDALANVTSSDIVEITVVDSDGKSLTLKRPGEDGDLVLEGLSEDEEMDTLKVDSLSSVLRWLNFSDVADPGLPEKDTGLDEPTVYVAKTGKGKVYTIRIGGSPEGTADRYLRLSAVFEPPEDDEASGAEDKKNGDKEAGEEDKAQDEQEKSAKEVREFNEKVENWTYLVDSYKIDGITADRDDLIKEKEKEEEKEE